MTLQEMARPELLAAAPDSEIRQAFHRLSQLYGAARGRGGAVETYVNAAVFVIGEMERRGFRVSEDLPLVRAARALSRKAAVRGEAGDVPEAVKPVLSGLPEEIVLVRDFVSLVGSAAVAEEPADLDVLVRAAYDARRDAYALHGPSVNVSLRRFLDPEKSRGLHFIDSPQGPFTDYIPLYDLVFRRRAAYVERAGGRLVAYYITLGEYVHAGTAEDLKQVYESLTSRIVLETGETEVTALFTAAAAGLLILSALLSLLWFRRVF